MRSVARRRQRKLELVNSSGHRVADGKSHAHVPLIAIAAPDWLPIHSARTIHNAFELDAARCCHDDPALRVLEGLVGSVTITANQHSQVNRTTKPHSINRDFDRLRTNRTIGWRM